MTRARKAQPKAREWEPMRRARPVPPTAAQIRAVEDLGLDTDEVFDPNREIWRNDRYVVHVDRKANGDVISLSIRRHDRRPARDWRDFQRIKNEVAGYDIEAVELYPSQIRVVDTANQYWLWCFPPGQVFPAGFTRGNLIDDPTVMPGSKQRPVPADWR